MELGAWCILSSFLLAIAIGVAIGLVVPSATTRVLFVVEAIHLWSVCAAMKLV